MSYFGRWTNTNFSTGTGGVHFSRRQTNNQKAAVIAHASDITPRLRRRARTSMFISLETGHLVWDSNNLFFIFYFFSWLVQFYFFHETISKKVDPNFADRFDQSGRPRLMHLKRPKRRSGASFVSRSRELSNIAVSLRIGISIRYRYHQI